MKSEFDILVIGSGAAGLTAALALADAGKRVCVLSKGGVDAGSTRWAQGGIAAVLDRGDSVESHIDDTLKAGAGLCHEDAVRLIVSEGRGAVERLIDAGVPFSKAGDDDSKASQYHLTREGGHTRRRVIHVDDATGQALQGNLAERALNDSRITVLDQAMALDLITTRHLQTGGANASARCFGAYVFDRARGGVQPLLAPATVLATGGASKVYLYTSNPDGSTGDGIAMAWRAGCRVANMEFNQFHPTCLYHPEAKSFLITEALRGEGAKLTLPDGKQFLGQYDERAELAPRDIVARAIDNEMKRRGLDHVMLDISHRDADFITAHFPNIQRRCAEFGFDITRGPVPVVPAAHYTCGGVMTDLDGRADLAGLYAIGECAHTGLHGANRMASNSLLECLVMARAAVGHILEHDMESDDAIHVRHWDESRVTDSDEEVVVSHNWDELRRFMWDYVGIVRTDKRLERAQHRIDLLEREIQEYYGNFRVTPDLLELRNLVTVSGLIVRSARARKESRGLHYTVDYPDLLARAEDTVLTPDPT